MNHSSENYFEIIKKQLHQNEFDLVSIASIPHHSDRMVQARTLQDMIEEIEGSEQEPTMKYLLQIKPKNQNFIKKKSKQHPESIFFPNGKINIYFLTKNADLLFDAGEYKLAKNILKYILRSGEQRGFTLYKIGRCLEAENKITEAQMHYEESLNFSPILECYQRLGSILLAQQKDEACAELFERALHLKDLKKETRFELHKACGNCWARSQKNQEAEKHFQAALHLDPSSDTICSNLGLLALQKKKIQEAKRYFQDALIIQPKNYLALSGLGSCALAENNKVQAHDYFAQSLEMKIENPTAILHLIRCAYEIKSYATAEKLLETYILETDANADLIYSLAGLQLQLGKIDEAHASIARFLRMEPHHLGAQELLETIKKYSGIKES
jgi:tetratricopeptide (TPR) repeat protein